MLLGLAMAFATEVQSPLLSAIVEGGNQNYPVIDYVASHAEKLAAALTATTGTFALTWRWLVGLIKEGAADSTYGSTVKALLGKLALFLLALALPALIYITYLSFTVIALQQINHPLHAAPGHAFVRVG